MIEYIKSVIMGIITGLTAPLPVSSSGHFSLGNKLLGFTDNPELSALYYSVFMIAFSVVIMISLRELYSRLFKGVSKNRKNYRLRLGNLIASVAVGIILFIPIPVIGNSLTDYFNMFIDFENILNSILIGLAAVFTGFMLAVAVWYISTGRAPKKKTVPIRSAMRMCIYSIPGHIISGASRVALSTVNLALCDVKADVIFREAYFYLAPQILTVNVIRAALLIIKGVRPDLAILAVGTVAVIASALLATAIVRKVDSKKLLIIFGGYSLIFGIGVIAYTLMPIFSGV